MYVIPIYLMQVKIFLPIRPATCLELISLLHESKFVCKCKNVGMCKRMYTYIYTYDVMKC